MARLVCGAGDAQALGSAGLAEPAGGKRRPRSPDLDHACASARQAGAAWGGDPAAAMDVGPVTICGEVTILHGGFLLASRLCHPKPLSELTKSDWSVVGKPILEALQEICTSYSSYPHQPNLWKRKAAVVLWSKIILSSVPSDERWKSDAFFSVSNAIPEINRTVLFELFKAINAPRLFAQLLLALPDPLCQRELRMFVEYVAKDTSPADVAFFLDVWWEIMKHKGGEEDRLVLLFQSVTHQHVLESEELGQPPKRFKSGPSSTPENSAVPLTLPILTEGLKMIKDNLGSSRMKCYALANLVDVLSALVATEREAKALSPQAYLEKISSVVTLWSCDGENRYSKKDLDVKVKEAERSMSLLDMGKLSKQSVLFNLSFLLSLLKEWSSELQVFLNDPRQVCYESYRLLDCLASLQKRSSDCGLEDLDQARLMLDLGKVITDLLKKVNPETWGKNTGGDLVASVAMMIIDKKMDRHKEVCSVFAKEKSWALSKDWAACLIKNKELFQDPELILKLLETVASLESSEDSSRNQEEQTKIVTIILECYTELTLPDKNQVIAGVLATWGRQGLSKLMVAFSKMFQEELNVAFNQIIKSTSGESFKKAILAVSRLVVLNPEGTIKKISNLAIANLGTHQFLAEILCSFPSLNFQEPRDPPEVSVNFLLECLKETVWDRLSSPKEKEQFLEFLVHLMQPSGTSPLLSPAEVIQSLIFPFLKSDSPRIELCLQILDKALKVPLEQSWIHTCHPFPLVFSLCKLLDGFCQYWHQPQDQERCSLETKDLVVTNLAQLCDILLVQKDSLSPQLWTQSVAWLHKKINVLDWTIGLRVKNIFGEHFKNEVPATLFEVCKLPEEEWTTRPLPNYGPGSGLLAWLETCCVSTALREQMLVLLVINVDNPEEVNLFSKGFLVALVQVFPWCSQSEWRRLVHVIKSLLEREILYVPYSLEYVQYLPLLNFRPFAYHLQLSVLLLRAFQFLCGSSGTTWMPAEAWKHIGRLYCLSLSDLLGSVKTIARGQWHSAEEKNVIRELSFVYIQIFCHTLHIAAMLPNNGTGEPLLLLSLEVLSQYEMLYDLDESLGSALRKANEIHFLESIVENVTNKELRTMLLHKLHKL
ncbi:gem-associated protein 4 [Pantherophis guttatus]|uniref:Gem-associated protein 4 n=1 Tax=Pantherophis guttatus TaxID=94885 RepID=A0ABM3ZLJ0_PANGU|nr:gem-associated protein 4 [Pantherophis guttatus]